MESNNESTSVSRLRDNVVIRLAVYYAAVLAFFAGLAALFPSIVEYLNLERLRVATGAQDFLGTGGGEGGVAIDTLFATDAIVHSTDPEQVEKLTDLVFGRYAKEWRLNRVADGESGSRMLEFSVRLKKRVEPATVENAIRESGGSPIVRVESASR